MNEYAIYQVRDGLIREWGFSSLEQLRRDHPDQLGLPREVWREVYRFRTKKEPSLDWIYHWFNSPARPDSYEGRSMSVGDIVETPDGKLWYCDSFGWEEVRWAPEEAEA